jgi:hypothetical protein
MSIPGHTRYQVIDEDGDDLPGSWEFGWEDHDPFEVVIAAVTEVSGRPWKWSGKRRLSGRLSPQKCRALVVRLDRVLRSDRQPQTAQAIARVTAENANRRRPHHVDVAAVQSALHGPQPDLFDAPPELLAAAMLRALHAALRAAVECQGGLRVSWQVE